MLCLIWVRGRPVLFVVLSGAQGSHAWVGGVTAVNCAFAPHFFETAALLLWGNHALVVYF